MAEAPKPVCDGKRKQVTFFDFTTTLRWDCGAKAECGIGENFFGQHPKLDGNVDMYNGNSVDNQSRLDIIHWNAMLRNAKTEARAFYTAAKKAFEGKKGFVAQKVESPDQAGKRKYKISGPMPAFEVTFSFIDDNAYDLKIISVLVHDKCNTYQIFDPAFVDTTALSAIVFKVRLPLENMRRVCEKQWGAGEYSVFPGAFDECTTQLKADVKKALLEEKKNCIDDKTCDELAQRIGTEKEGKSWSPIFEASATIFWTKKFAPTPPAPSPAAPAVPAAPAPKPADGWGN